MDDGKTANISIDALRGGDRYEFSRLVETHSAPLYRLGLKMLGHPQDAEDVLQNTFLKALQYLPEFEGRSSVSTWLYRIAVNEALMLLRKRRPETSLVDLEKESEENEDYTPHNLTDWCCLPEEELLSVEGQNYLDAAIQHLPEKLKIVFLLRDVEGLSIEETGQVLNLSATAIKTRLLRARLRLREEISTYYGERVEAKEKAE